MKVAFDERPTADTRGIGRYARCLLEALHTEAAHRGGEVVESHRPRRVDVFHSPWIDGAMLRPPVPQVVTLHDLVPLKRPGQYLRSGLRFRMRYLAVGRAARLVVPTQAVARDAEELLQFDPERIHVVPEAAAASFSPRSAQEVDAARGRYDLPDDYLVWVGGLRHPDPRKRVKAMADAHHDLPLVLVGEPGPWAFELPRVQLTGRVDDDDLAAILSGARALVLPSDEEGFGLPTVEALACGTPVVACDHAAAREVLGDRATFVESGDFDGLLAAGARAERPAPAPPRWTWDDAADATWSVYEKALGD